MQGKRSGDGDQKDVEEEICVTVNNFFCSVSVNFFVCVSFSWTVPHGEQSLVRVLYDARAHSNII